MKIYIVDKYNKVNKLADKLNSENIEFKENCNFKMTKNDYVIINDECDFEDMDKLKNIIFLVKEKEYKHIWKLVNTYKSIDIIDSNMPFQYIADRINKKIKE